MRYLQGHPHNGRLTHGMTKSPTFRRNVDNRRNTRRYTYAGTTRTLAEWAQVSGLGYGRLVQRLDTLKWSFEKAITTPRLFSRKGRPNRMRAMPDNQPA